MGVVAEIEGKLAQLREKASVGDSAPVMRTSTMTHVVWAPPAWLRAARDDAGRPPRPPPGADDLPRPRAAADDAGSRRPPRLHAVQVDEAREAFAEVIEVHLCGASIAHPASIVLPLLISDLPVFCRWRGEPDWNLPQLTELVGVADRLVVNSSEWRSLPAAYERLALLFDHVAVSDIAFSRTLPWRARLAQRWPGIRTIDRLSVEGPKADALLLAGWLRSRLRRDVALSRRGADEVRAIRIDGTPLDAPVGELESGSDLLSDELDNFGRDPVFEGAVQAALT